MYFRIKVSNLPDVSGITTFLLDEDNFANAAYKVIEQIGTTADIEEIKLMKNFKPAINEKYDPNNKLYIIKIAEDMNIEGKIKTVKYVYLGNNVTNEKEKFGFSCCSSSLTYCGMWFECFPDGS